MIQIVNLIEDAHSYLNKLDDTLRNNNYNKSNQRPSNHTKDKMRNFPFVSKTSIQDRREKLIDMNDKHQSKHSSKIKPLLFIQRL